MTTMGGSPIPLIAFTADATPMTRERCLEAGMAACLAKPVEPEQLLSLIDEVVQNARGAKTEPPAPPVNSRVTEIASHPRFRGPAQPAVEIEALARLRSLGGEAFLIEVCDLFRGEASTALRELRAAAKDADATRFRTHAHALRSVAANVGARNLSEVCLPAQNISAQELRKNGANWLDQVEAELARIDLALADYCTVRDAQAKS
jgi:two-component system sensor histidine kinase RpfC